MYELVWKNYIGFSMAFWGGDGCLKRHYMTKVDVVRNLFFVRPWSRSERVLSPLLLILALLLEMLMAGTKPTQKPTTSRRGLGGISIECCLENNRKEEQVQNIDREHMWHTVHKTYASQ